MQASAMSVSPGHESVYDLIYGLVPKSGGIEPSVLWSRFWREYLSDSHRTRPAALPLLNAKKRPIPVPFDVFLSQLCLSDVMTMRKGKVYRVRCSGVRLW